MRKSSFTEEQIIKVLKEHAARLSASDLCLDEHLFANLNEARQIIEAWRIDCNTNRSHTSLNGLTSTEFTARLKERQNWNRFSL